MLGPAGAATSTSAAAAASRRRRPAEPAERRGTPAYQRRLPRPFRPCRFSLGALYSRCRLQTLVKLVRYKCHMSQYMSKEVPLRLRNKFKYVETRNT